MSSGYSNGSSGAIKGQRSTQISVFQYLVSGVCTGSSIFESQDRTYEGHACSPYMYRVQACTSTTPHSKCTLLRNVPLGKAQIQKKIASQPTTPHQGTVLYQVITTCRTCFELPHSHVRTDRTGWPFSLASTNIGRHGKRPESSSPVSKVIPV